MKDKYAIDITTPKNPIKCHNLLSSVKKGKVESTTEFAIMLLHATNNRKNIAVFIEVLDKHLEATPSAYETYRPYLIALICKREHPDYVYESIAKTALKHTTLKNADKIDRDFFTALTKINTPEELKKEVQSMHEKLLEKLPIDVQDVVEEASRIIIKEQQGAPAVATYIIENLPEQRKKKSLFRRKGHKKMGR